MNRILWEARRAQWRLGTPGLLAAVIVAVVMSIILLEIVPTKRDIETRQHELETRSVKLLEPPPPTPDEAVGPVSADQRFFVFLHSFHAIAAKNGVSIPQVSYEPPKDEGALRRYAVTGTFSTTYPQLRNFIADLRRLPGARCQRVAVSRPNIGVTQLEVRIQCSFLVEGAQ
jgi:hypothetical protein